MVSLNANGIITRHDVPDADYIMADDDWPAVVDLIQRGDCLATLITDTFLLTVAHCAQDMNNDWVLTINGVDHDVAEIILHPDYQGGRYDIALVRLEAAVQGVTPFPLYRGTDDLGQRLILVGRGLHTTGLEGAFPMDTEGGDLTVVGEGNCGCQTSTGTAWLAALLTLPWIRRRRRGQLSG